MRRISLLLVLAGCADAQASTWARSETREALSATPRLGQLAPAQDPWSYVAPEPAGGDRIYSKVRHLWITPRPAKGGWLGYLSMGDSVRVKGGDADAAFVGKGHSKSCQAWYAVEPVGYVCTGDNATLDPKDPDIVELLRHAAGRTEPWPYHYAESLNTPVYHRLPSLREQKQNELDLDEHLAAAGRNLAGKPPPRWLDLPPGGMALQTRVVNGSTVAFTDTFDHEGRAFALSWDRGFVPVDRLKPYPEIPFHGVVLGKQHRLPIAFFRVEDRPQYRRAGSDFSTTGKMYPRLGWVALSGKAHDGYLETKDGHWVKAADASVVRRRTDVPIALRDQRDGRRTWIDVDIGDGTFVAYEGETPVYATLMSPGRGGAPKAGVPPLDSASTPTGTFAILGKFVTATMVSSSISTIVHAEVQFTQNIGGPWAIHGAYWHDRFGEPKSGGCVNLSPIDSMRIFEWTEPRLPEGWHGMRSVTSGHNFGARTLVSIHE